MREMRSTCAAMQGVPSSINMPALHGLFGRVLVSCGLVEEGTSWRQEPGPAKDVHAARLAPPSLPSHPHKALASPARQQPHDRKKHHVRAVPRLRHLWTQRAAHASHHGSIIILIIQWGSVAPRLERTRISRFPPTPILPFRHRRIASHTRAERGREGNANDRAGACG